MLIGAHLKRIAARLESEHRAPLRDAGLLPTFSLPHPTLLDDEDAEPAAVDHPKAILDTTATSAAKPEGPLAPPSALAGVNFWDRSAGLLPLPAGVALRLAQLQEQVFNELCVVGDSDDATRVRQQSNMNNKRTKTADRNTVQRFVRCGGESLDHAFERCRVTAAGVDPAGGTTAAEAVSLLSGIHLSVGRDGRAPAANKLWGRGEGDEKQKLHGHLDTLERALADLIRAGGCVFADTLARAKTSCRDRHRVFRRLLTTFSALFRDLCEERALDERVFAERISALDEEVAEIRTFLRVQKENDPLVRIENLLHAKLQERIDRKHGEIAEIKAKRGQVSEAVAEMEYGLELLLPNFGKYMDFGADIFCEEEDESNDDGPDQSSRGSRSSGSSSEDALNDDSSSASSSSKKLREINAASPTSSRNKVLNSSEGAFRSSTFLRTTSSSSRRSKGPRDSTKIRNTLNNSVNMANFRANFGNKTDSAAVSVSLGGRRDRRSGRAVEFAVEADEVDRGGERPSFLPAALRNRRTQMVVPAQQIRISTLKRQETNTLLSYGDQCGVAGGGTAAALRKSNMMMPSLGEEWSRHSLAMGRVSSYGGGTGTGFQMRHSTTARVSAAGGCGAETVEGALLEDIDRAAHYVDRYLLRREKLEARRRRGNKNGGNKSSARDLRGGRMSSGSSRARASSSGAGQSQKMEGAQKGVVLLSDLLAPHLFPEEAGKVRGVSDGVEEGGEVEDEGEHDCKRKDAPLPAVAAVEAARQQSRHSDASSRASKISSRHSSKESGSRSSVEEEETNCAGQAP